MNNGAPVCPVSRDQPLPGMPETRLPVPFKALDLPSLLQASNALRDMLNSMLGNKTSTSIGPAPTSVGGVVQNWLEIGRDTQQKRIYQKGSKNSYVDVLRINTITFHYLYNNYNHPEEEFRWENG